MADQKNPLTLCFATTGDRCEFAYIAFYHIWIISPLMKVFEINCGLCQRIYANIVNCCIVPCCEACGSVYNTTKYISYTELLSITF
jgi:hypothetical protein